MTNPKYPYEYINGIGKVIEDKSQLVPFQRGLTAGG